MLYSAVSPTGLDSLAHTLEFTLTGAKPSVNAVLGLLADFN